MAHTTFSTLEGLWAGNGWRYSNDRHGVAGRRERLARDVVMGYAEGDDHSTLGIRASG
jgi:hypothetical protein